MTGAASCLVSLLSSLFHYNYSPHNSQNGIYEYKSALTIPQCKTIQWVYTALKIKIKLLTTVHRPLFYLRQLALSLPPLSLFISSNCFIFLLELLTTSNSINSRFKGRVIPRVPSSHSNINSMKVGT